MFSRVTTSEISRNLGFENTSGSLNKVGLLESLSVSFIVVGNLILTSPEKCL